MSFTHCVHTVLVIGKHIDTFRGDFSGGEEVGGEGYVEESFHG